MRARVWAAGSASGRNDIRPSLALVLERLGDKFLVDDGCWPGTASKDGRGYGQIRVDKKIYQAHRLLFTIMRGPIEAGVELDHLCRWRACVRPDHLEPVSGHQNTLRGLGPTATNARKQTCPRGHVYDLLNTYIRAGKRYCRACRSGAN